MRDVSTESNSVERGEPRAGRVLRRGVALTKGADLFLVLVRLACWLVVAPAPAHAADGILYFNRIQNIASPVALHRANADGTGEQWVPAPLPAAFNPTVSRDGQLVLLTSGNPLRPFKLSNDVFVYDVASGGVARVTGYEDIVQYRGGILLTNDAAGTNVIGDRNVVGYSVNYPFHKALSPDRTRVVTVNLQRVGTSTTDVPRTNGTFELFLGSYRAPIVEVFTAGDPAPFGQAIHLGGDRTGFNQGGDGVDWHPTREEIVVAARSDIPATGNAGVNLAEGTVIAVFESGGIAPFLRRLTSPVGTWDTFAQEIPAYATSSTQHDYTPAISPDGSRVAYVRHTQRTDSRVSLGPLLALCEIRVIQYDGSGDRRVLPIAEGLWVTHLAWSPDGAEIAFDLSPQIVANGWPALLGDATRSAIYVVDLDGSNPRLAIEGPASHPSWAPGRIPTADTPVELRLENGLDGSIVLRALGGGPDEMLQVESSEDLAAWSHVADLQQTSAGAEANFAVESGVRARFYRVVRAVP
jgi:hypothetical protein